MAVGSLGGMGQGSSSGGGIGSFLWGTPAQLHQPSRFSPEGMQALMQLLSGGMQQYQNPYAGFQPIADQARQSFQQNIIPSIAERFTSMGAGAQSSPAFAQTLGSASAGLESNLAAQRAQFGLQNQGMGLQALGLGLTDPYHKIETNQQGGLLQQILPSLGRIGMHAGAAALTGGASAVPSALIEILRMLASPKN